ncbi:hypothetical protein JCM1841_002190 [Sporobolomyces salmonicolor]
MDDPVIARRSPPRPAPASDGTGTIPASRSRADADANRLPDEDQEHLDPPPAGLSSHGGPLESVSPSSSAPRSSVNPISFLSSSSPSRAISRIWDRFSPPSLPSPFSLPHVPSLPTSLLARSSAPPDPPPAAPDDFRRRRPPTPEERDSASQLSFSLRRAAGARWTRSGDSARRSASVGEGWEPFKLPTMPKWTPGKGKEKEKQLDSDDNMLEGTGIDDEACFVDGWEGKVDFLVSLPSEISLYILLHLDFRSLLSCGVVSRQWRALSLDPLIWRDLFHQNPRWVIRPEAYRLASQTASAAAALAAASSSSAATHGGYFGDRPVMPNLKRAASSFGKAGVKRVVTGADRVTHGGAALGRKLTGIVTDLGSLSLTPPGSRSTSRAASEAGDGERSRPSTPLAADPSMPTRPSIARRSTATALMTLTSPAGPSTSTLSTHAFASPPSTSSLSRTNSSTALSSLASSLSSLPPNLTPSRRASTATIPPLLPPPSPSLTFRPEAPLFLDWPRLFRDRWLLEGRWEKGKPSWNWLEGHEDSVYCVQFDEKKVISGSRDKTIRIWDLASGTTTRTLTGHEGSVLCLQYDDQVLISGSSDSRILVWDLVGEEGTGRGKYEVKMSLVGHAMGVLDLCFDDKWIVSCSKDTTTRVWNRQTGELYRTLSGHRGPVNAVALRSDQVITASGDALMKLWDLHTGQTLRTFTGHSRGLACVSWAPSGREFVSGGNDKVIKLWNAETGECVRTFEGHQDLVRSLSFDEQSRRIVSASYDRSTRVWDADTGEMKTRYRSHASLVFDVAFDASRIVSSSHDQRILVMDFGAGLDVTKFAS